MFACNEVRRINRVRLIPMVVQQVPMLAVCLQGSGRATTTSYWSEVFLFNADAGQRFQQLPILMTPHEFVASPGPGIVPGLSFVVPGELAGLPPQSQAVISANLMYPAPVYSHPVQIPPVKKVRFEEAVDLHGLGHPGVALASSNRPPLVRDEREGWRMLEGALRPHRLYAARPNILIGLGRTSGGSTAAVAWNINRPYVLHTFGGRKDVSHIAVSTSGELVAVAAPDGISVHRPTGEEVLDRLPVEDRVDGLLIDDSGSGVHVVCVSPSGIKLWEATRKAVVGDFPAVAVPADEPVLECQFAPTSGSPKVVLATSARVVMRSLG
ncbi:hypothetical protein GCM10009838_47840 [Catenulispora subtropica]|uniref:Uncharacterized protein n=1 Tax=Catenulispora subtropica TaxID=450798 RepID=A0ABN2S620_9ACTN